MDVLTTILRHSLYYTKGKGRNLDLYNNERDEEYISLYDEIGANNYSGGFSDDIEEILKTQTDIILYNN